VTLGNKNLKTMKTKTMLTAMALVIAMTFFACKGDTGAAGPAGTNGTANISNSTATISPGEWNNPSSGFYEVGLSVSAITDYNNDDVQCYIQTSSGGGWFALPQTSFLTNGDDMTFDVVSGGVNILYLNSSAPTITLAFRAVVIPPTEVAKMKANKVDLNDYNQVNAYIKLNSK
jgi:hypothetical protein